MLGWIPIFPPAETLQNLRIRERLWKAACANSRNLFRGCLLELELRFFGIPGGMIGDDQPRVPAEARVVGQRFLLEYVESGCSKMILVEGLEQRVAIHNWTARGVYEDGTAFRPAQSLRVDQVTGFRQQRAMETHVVGLGEQRLEIDELHAQSIRAAFFKKRVTCEHPQTPTGELLSDGAADFSETNEAKRSAGHAIDRLFAMNIPAAILHF